MHGSERGISKIGVVMCAIWICNEPVSEKENDTLGRLETARRCIAGTIGKGRCMFVCSDRKRKPVDRKNLIKLMRCVLRPTGTPLDEKFGNYFKLSFEF